VGVEGIEGDEGRGARGPVGCLGRERRGKNHEAGRECRKKALKRPHEYIISERPNGREAAWPACKTRMGTTCAYGFIRIIKFTPREICTTLWTGVPCPTC
jgi:hypothetical protein